MAWKSGLKVPVLPLGPSCPLQTILLNDLIGCNSSLHIVIAVWCTFFKFNGHQTTIIVSRGLPHPTHQVQIFKRAPYCHYYLQQAVAPDWMGSIALCELKYTLNAVFSRVEKPSEDMTSRLFLVNIKGLNQLLWEGGGGNYST